MILFIHTGHYSDVVMSVMVSQITGVSIVYSTICSGADQNTKPRVTGLCEGNSPVTGEFPAQRACNAEKFQFDDVIMIRTKIFLIKVEVIVIYGAVITWQYFTQIRIRLVSSEHPLEMGSSVSRPRKMDHTPCTIFPTVVSVEWQYP